MSEILKAPVERRKFNEEQVVKRQHVIVENETTWSTDDLREITEIALLEPPAELQNFLVVYSYKSEVYHYRNERPTRFWELRYTPKMEKDDTFVTISLQSPNSSRTHTSRPLEQLANDSLIGPDILKEFIAFVRKVAFETAFDYGTARSARSVSSICSERDIRKIKLRATRRRGTTPEWDRRRLILLSKQIDTIREKYRAKMERLLNKQSKLQGRAEEYARED